MLCAKWPIVIFNEIVSFRGRIRRNGLFMNPVYSSDGPVLGSILSSDGQFN